MRWKARKGYAATEAAVENSSRECIWFSPHCLTPGQRTMLAIERRDGDTSRAYQALLDYAAMGSGRSLRDWQRTTVDSP